MNKENVLKFTLEEFKDHCVDLGLKPFVAKQVFEWVYGRYVDSFDDMTNLSKSSRDTLSKAFVINPFVGADPIGSKEGHAIKYILEARDGLSVEAVVLKDPRYVSLCVSSQCGCPVDCKFCVTGKVGFKRQLEVDEIVGQVWLARKEGYPISRLVFMGMGEPLLNYDRLFKAIELINAEYGLGISGRKITISTSGQMAPLKRLIREERFVNLAFSVGHPNPALRIALMPLEKRNPIMEFVPLLKQYLSMHNRKLTLEYTLIKGRNDSQEALKELGNMALFLDAKVNLINLNPHPLIPFSPVSSQSEKDAKQLLKSMGVRCTIRFRKGQEISAACGQLGESLC